MVALPKMLKECAELGADFFSIFFQRWICFGNVGDVVAENLDAFWL